MKISKNKKQQLKKILKEHISDMEINDVVIDVEGYQDYNIVNFETSLNINKILKDILKIIEG